VDVRGLHCPVCEVKRMFPKHGGWLAVPASCELPDFGDGA
jgi:hypothetical protein